MDNQKPGRSLFDLSDLKSDKKLFARAWAAAVESEVRTAKQQASRFSVVFRVHCNTTVGQSLRVTGEHWKLGGWAEKKALPLTWTEGNWWVGEVLFDDVPSKRLEFKYILEARHRKTRWEDGANRVIQLTEGGELRRGTVYHVLNHSWTL